MSGSGIDPFWEAQFVFGDRYPERNAFYAKLDELSVAARRDCPGHIDLPYGQHPRQRLDLFPGPEGAPLVTFIHGGYWRSQEKARYSFVARPFLRRGFSVAVLGYPLAPEWPVRNIIRSLESALDWLAAHGPESRVSPAATYLCGHSAGGHLAASLASRRRLPGSVSISGIFDLRPLVRTSINDDLRLDESEAAALSLLLQPPPGPGWLVTAVGDAETQVFKDQAAEYSALWSSGGAPSAFLPIPGANHYTVLLDLLSDDSQIIGAMCARMVASEGAGGG